MADQTAPANTAVAPAAAPAPDPAGGQAARAAQAAVQQQTQSTLEQALAAEENALEDAWAKYDRTPAPPEDLRPGRAREDGKDPTELDDQEAKGAEGQQDAAQGEGQQEAPSAAKKASKFAQAVRERARQSREQQARREALEQENARLRQMAQQGLSVQEQLAKDPIAVLRSQGKTSEEISRILLNSAVEQSPEAEVATLKQQIADLMRRDEQREQAARAARQQAEDQAKWNRFMGEQGSNAEAYPLLASTPEPLVKYAAQEVAKAIVADGQPLHAYDDEDFAEGIERWLKAHARQSRRAAASTGQEGQEAAGKQNGAAKQAARTMNPGLNGRRHSRPANWDQMTLQQQEEHIEEQWRKGDLPD